MVALIRYSLALMLHGQRYLAPVLLFIATLATFTINDGGPLAGTYVVCAGAVLICSCWLTVTIVNAEDPVRRSITIVNAGHSRRVLLALINLALLLSLALTSVGMVFPLVSGRHVITAAGLLVGLQAQLTCGSVGIAVGLFCSRLVIPRPGYSLIVALVTIIAVPLTRGLPPINPMLRLMSSDRPAAQQIPSIAGYLAVGVVLLLISGFVTQFIAARRD